MSEAGAAYFGRISIGLGQISEAILVVKQRQRKEIRISMPPSFARKWFVPRMAAFMDLHPDISLHIDASATVVDFEHEAIDVALRHFAARESSKLAVELLFLDELRVYCSRTYAETLHLRQPGDLVCATLLATRIHPYWERWFAQFSTLPGRDIGAIATIHFDASHLAIDTARRHQGAGRRHRCPAFMAQARVQRHAPPAGGILRP